MTCTQCAQSLQLGTPGLCYEIMSTGASFDSNFEPKQAELSVQVECPKCKTANTRVLKLVMTTELVG